MVFQNPALSPDPEIASDFIISFIKSSPDVSRLEYRPENNFLRIVVRDAYNQTALAQKLQNLGVIIQDSFIDAGPKVEEKDRYMRYDFTSNTFKISSRAEIDFYRDEEKNTSDSTTRTSTQTAVADILGHETVPTHR